jgi:CRISPR system Cascade subunit CasE
MYISRMPLNTARPEAIKLVSSPYRVHSAVEHAFSPSAVRSNDQGRILWRLDSSAKDKDSLWLYVVSPEKPDFSHVVEQVGWPTTASWESKDYSPVLDRIDDGQLWQFRLKANPARKVFKDQGRRERPSIVGKVQGHVTVAQQLEWLVSRSGDHGFDLANDSNGSPIIDVSQRHSERFSRGRQMVTINTVVFDGILTVTDADAFRRTLGFGIGRAKGFGCGLLTISPVR